MRYFKILFLFILVSLLITGCVSQQGLKQQKTGPAQTRIDAPPRYLLNLDQAADDVKLVLSALVNKMRGDIEPIKGVVFDPSADNRVKEVNCLNQGFALNIIDISGYQAIKISDKKAKAFIEGYFQFKDFIGRMASFYFIANYSLTPNALTIHSCATLPMPSLSPILETYFIPKSAFDEVSINEFNSFTDLYLFALMYAVPMMPTDEERKEYEARKNMSFISKIKASIKEKREDDDYYILVFCMNWLSPESSLEMKVSKTTGMGGKNLAEPVYLYWENWRVLIAGGNFDPHATRGIFYTNVAYNFDPKSGTKPVFLGSFANRKNFTVSRRKSLNVQVVTRKEETTSPVDTNPAPLKSESVLLDPYRKADAMKIQKQLAKLGYYKTKVDGMFGKGSRKALKQFKQDHNLGENDSWDINTQKVLFKNSGL
jgi:hypothetical protein